VSIKTLGKNKKRYFLDRGWREFILILAFILIFGKKKRANLNKGTDYMPKNF
jgi:hypothetical protein